jgi:hypothetical protein
LGKELRNLYSSPRIIKMIKSRRMRWRSHVARKREEKYNSGGKARRKELLGRARHRWEDNIYLRGRR